MSLYALSSEVMETTTGNNVWEYEYAKIFNANTIIASVGSVNGSQEEKDEALCNAYLMRGWSFFRLATVHCLPYSEANRSEMGLPLRLGTLFTEDISRATLGKTFDRILDDFREAENTVWWTGYRKALPGGRPNVPLRSFCPRVSLHERL